MSNEAFFELQTPITFFGLEITSTMYILRERGILGDFESVQDKVESCKEKWISVRNPFRSEMTKTIILHKKCVSLRRRSNYRDQNDLEGISSIGRDLQYWLADYWPIIEFSAYNVVVNHEKSIKKSIFSKFLLIGPRCF